MPSEEVGPVTQVAMDANPEIRYIIRRNGLVLTKPERPGAVLRWLTECEAGNAIVTYVTDRAAINACAMIAHDAEVVQQTKEVLQ